MTPKSFDMHHKVCNVLIHIQQHGIKLQHNVHLGIGWILGSPPMCWNCDGSL